MAKLKLIKLVLCGPGDVTKELEIARKVIEDWNRLHGEARGVVVKHEHWSTDSYPEASETGQGAVNKQLIKKAHVLVAVFWSRLGTPTQTAESGTVEEIRLGIAGEQEVLVYFSDRETLKSDADKDQAERIWQFRQELRATSSCAIFQSLNQFREQFTNHLALTLNKLQKTAKSRKSTPGSTTNVKQISKGNGNVQIAGNENTVNHYQRPPSVKTVLERRPGSVTPEEEHQLKEWIEALAENTPGKVRKAAYGELGKRFLLRFKVVKRADLASSQMGEVEAWYREQKGIQMAESKTKAPDQWRASCTKAIKAAMTSMGKSNEDYYPELSDRLNMKKPFVSLTKLTKTDLERVHRMVRRDSKR